MGSFSCTLAGYWGSWMRHWIFCATVHKKFGINDPMVVLRQRFADQFWGLGQKTPNRQALKAGDKVVFYLGNPHKAFAASATLASDSFELSQAQQDELSHGLTFYRTRYGVRLEQTAFWEELCHVEDVVPAMSLIENKENWGIYLMGGVRYLPEQDFRVITGRVSNLGVAVSGSPISTKSGSISQSQFALEMHLEEFIDKNWSHIDFGRKLRKYADDEENGRQFPADEWSIDFLCVDETSENLVVVELKKGQSSDATVGQVLRYISWVEENIAEKGQKVEGIIIAKEVDEALRYAVKNLPHINVLTYRVDFTLEKPALIESTIM